MKTRIFVDLALATSLSRQPFSSSCTQTLSRALPVTPLSDFWKGVFRAEAPFILCKVLYQVYQAWEIWVGKFQVHSDISSINALAEAIMGATAIIDALHP